MVVVLKSIHAFYTVCMQVLRQSVIDPHAKDCFCMYRIITDKKKKSHKTSEEIIHCNILSVLAIEFYPYFFKCP